MVWRYGVKLYGCLGYCCCSCCHLGSCNFLAGITINVRVSLLERWGAGVAFYGANTKSAQACLSQGVKSLHITTVGCRKKKRKKKKPGIIPIPTCTALFQILKKESYSIQTPPTKPIILFLTTTSIRFMYITNTKKYKIH